MHGKRGISDLVNVKTFGVGNGRGPFSAKLQVAGSEPGGGGERSTAPKEEKRC